MQQAVVTVLGAIQEEDFLGFSYGFRPGRGQHDALDALAVGIRSRKVNWIVDADLRSFFDEIDHGWMSRFLEHRITDQRIIRLIRKWLEVGVIEEGKRILAETGTPQGAVVSPLLANVYLHYAFDLWVQIYGFSAGGKRQGKERSSCSVTLTTVSWASSRWDRRERFSMHSFWMYSFWTYSFWTYSFWTYSFWTYSRNGPPSSV